MSTFFLEHPEFLATSRTSAIAERLNARHDAIVGSNPGAFANQRILDIASHDGRWSFAALMAGASHVTGIEPRAELVGNAQATLARYGIARDRYTFLTGDAFAQMASSNLRVDTVLCLGFFYHTIRHCELIDLIEKTGARDVIIDTEVVPRARDVLTRSEPIADPRIVHANPYSIQLFKEPVEHESMAFADSLTRHGHTLVGRPSREALSFILQHFGYVVKEYDWPDLLSKMSSGVIAGSLSDYAEGWRSTFHCTRAAVDGAVRDSARNARAGSC